VNARTLRQAHRGYLRRLAEAPWSRAPGVFHVTIAQDDDCNLLRHGGDCTCSPDISRRRDGSDLIEILNPDSSVTE
jgi:hypothetical protein